jgi:hypothetical protein
MSFAEALNQCLCSSIPFTLASLSIYAIYLANVSQTAMSKSQSSQRHHTNSTANAIDYTRNDYLLGSSDPTFWFLVPVFGTISIGLCIAINYVTLAITHIFCWIYSQMRTMPARNEDGRFVNFFPAFVKFSADKIQKNTIRVCCYINATTHPHYKRSPASSIYSDSIPICVPRALHSTYCNLCSGSPSG